MDLPIHHAFQALTGTDLSLEPTTSSDSFSLRSQPTKSSKRTQTTCPLEILSHREKWLKMDESHAQIRRMATWVEAWTRAAAMNKRDKGTFMVLAGPPGTGKTHACRMAGRFLRDHAIDFWMQGHWTGKSSVPALQWAVFSKAAGLERREWDDWLADCADASWIILDDVGSETDRYRSGEPAERLRRVLDLGRSRFLLVSTNVAPVGWKDAFDARVADRMAAAKTLDLTGAPSFRAKGGA